MTRSRTKIVLLFSLFGSGSGICTAAWIQRGLSAEYVDILFLLALVGATLLVGNWHRLVRRLTALQTVIGCLLLWVSWVTALFIFVKCLALSWVLTQLPTAAGLPIALASAGMIGSLVFAAGLAVVTRHWDNVAFRLLILSGIGVPLLAHAIAGTPTSTASDAIFGALLFIGGETLFGALTAVWLLRAGLLEAE